MRQEKQLLLNEASGIIERHGSFVIIRYSGLNSEMTTNFRQEVIKAGGDVEMLRKRLLIQAAQQQSITLTREMLPGHIGLVFGGNDFFEVTQTVFRLAQELNNAVEVIGGRFDGKMYNGNEIEAISKLPPLPQMRAEFLATLEAPLSHTLGVLDALLCSVPHCLENKSQKEEGSK